MTKTADTASKRQNAELREYLLGGFVEQHAEIDEKKFLANRHPPMFLVYSVFLRYFKNVYRIFEGDLVLALVLAEIWLFNMARFFSRAGFRLAADVLNDPDKRRSLLPGCNAYSISQVLGVPSETVRRKVLKLEQSGWIERNHEGGLITTVKLEEVFTPALTLHDLRHFLGSARMLKTLLEGD